MENDHNNKCYSIDDERYSDYDDLMSDLREYHDVGETVEVWEADLKICSHIDFIDVYDLIYRMQSNADDERGEVAEGYLSELTYEQKHDLKNHIAEWFNKNTKMEFCGVENEHKITVVVE